MFWKDVGQGGLLAISAAVMQLSMAQGLFTVRNSFAHTQCVHWTPLCMLGSIHCYSSAHSQSSEYRPHRCISCCKRVVSLRTLPLLLPRPSAANKRKRVAAPPDDDEEADDDEADD